MSRLVVIGSVIADLMMSVPHLPERGGDVLAGPIALQPGGAFNVIAAASRLGLPTVVAGKIGTGPVGSMLAEAIAELGAVVALPRVLTGDSGSCIGFVEPDGERTFVTSPGVEQVTTAADLSSVQWLDDDSVYVSGYDLLYPTTGPAVAQWASSRHPFRLLVDPGPLVAEVPTAVLHEVLTATSVLSLNARELGLLGGDVGSIWKHLTRPEAVIIVRVGAEGAWLHQRSSPPVLVPGHPVTAVDTTGAGDAHAGALLAFLAEGIALETALAKANVAAALAVTRRGSATGPTRASLEAAVGG